VEVVLKFYFYTDAASWRARLLQASSTAHNSDRATEDERRNKNPASPVDSAHRRSRSAGRFGIKKRREAETTGVTDRQSTKVNERGCQVWYSGCVNPL
jgi:hypothetical protein